MAFDEKRITSVRLSRQQELIESLAAMRVSERSDFCLICNNTDFFVHKVVLETSSPYFATMFSSKLAESNSGKAYFNEEEPDTLECIVDFIYLGAVEKIKTEEQLKKVLRMSHLMQLGKLSQYCCDGLTDLLSLENFFELFRLSETYELHTMQIKVRKFWLCNASKLAASDNFLSLSAADLKELLNCFLRQPFCLDETLNGVVQWFFYDLNSREKFASELLKCFDGNFISKDCVKALITTEVMKPTCILSRELKELAMVSLFSGNYISAQHYLSSADALSMDTKLTFVSRYHIVEAFDPSATDDEISLVHRRSARHDCIQQFNMDTMTWHPLKSIKFGSMFFRENTEMYQYDCQIRSLLINRQSRISDMKSNTSNPFVPKWSSLCFFKGLLFLFGQIDVNSTKPLTEDWCSCSPLELMQKSPVLLASSKFIYVLGINPESEDELVVQYNSNPAEEKWKVIRILRQGLDPKQFFVLNDTLNALYFGTSKDRHMTFDHDSEKWEFKAEFIWPGSELRLILSKFQDPRGPVVFFSAERDTLGIPIYTWEPRRGVWTKLPPRKGKCEIPQSIDAVMLYNINR